MARQAGGWAGRQAGFLLSEAQVGSMFREESGASSAGGWQLLAAGSASALGMRFALPLDVLTLGYGSAFQVVERVKLKAATFGQDLSNPEAVSSSAHVAADGAANGSSGAGGGSSSVGSYKVRPEVVAQLYEQWVMPLTKEVEVDYLLRRLDAA